VEGAALLDLSAGVASLVALLGYQLFLGHKLRGNPRYSLAAANSLARAAWVEYIMKSEDYILAVQTLRNSTMTASFMASTAVLLIIGLLNLAAQSSAAGDAMGGMWRAFSLFQHGTRELWLAKLIALVIVLLVVFFCFTMCIRLYNHVGYLVAVPRGAPNAMSAAGIARILNQGGAYFSRGMRSYYFSVPVLFWLFGPYFVVLSTAALIPVLWHIDRAPD
jgi:uncharacterized membrane protein